MCVIHCIYSMLSLVAVAVAVLYMCTIYVYSALRICYAYHCRTRLCTPPSLGGRCTLVYCLVGFGWVQ